MRLGTLAARPARFLSPCCERVPVHIVDAKYACPLCGTVCYDAMTLCVQAFGPGVERVVTARVDYDLPVYEGWIDRWLDV